MRFEPQPGREYLTDNPHRRCPIIDKARRLVGDGPELPVNEGVRRHLAYLRVESPSEKKKKKKKKKKGGLGIASKRRQGGRCVPDGRGEPQRPPAGYLRRQLDELLQSVIAVSRLTRWRRRQRCRARNHCSRDTVRRWGNRPPVRAQGAPRQNRRAPSACDRPRSIGCGEEHRAPQTDGSVRTMIEAASGLALGEYRHKRKPWNSISLTASFLASSPSPRRDRLRHSMLHGPAEQIEVNTRTA